MKKIEAIIRHFKLDDVKEKLREYGLLHGMTIAEAHGLGNQHGQEITYRGNSYARPFVPRLKIEIVAADEEAESVVTCILDAAYTGDVGDGKILVSNVDNVYRIRNGEEVKESVAHRPHPVVMSRRARITDEEQLTTDDWPLTSHN